MHIARVQHVQCAPQVHPQVHWYTPEKLHVYLRFDPQGNARVRCQPVVQNRRIFQIQNI